MINFVDNLLLIYGTRARVWLDNLPLLVAELSQRWQLRDLVVCSDLSYNYVTAGWQGEVPVVLKIGIDLNAIESEFLALQAFNGHGLIKLINADLTQGAILISRAIPGDTLISLFPEQDQKAIKIACDLIKNLHTAPIPVKNKFVKLEDWLKIIDQDWDIPHQHLAKARQLKQQLLKNSQRTVLLHGDLHYANVLDNGDEWVVIDPKGVIGDPLYDASGCLIREPFTSMMLQPNISELLTNRMQFVAHYFATDIKIIFDWTYVQTVMSIAWSLEDGQPVTEKLRFLETLSHINI